MRFMVCGEGLRKLLKTHAITKCCRSHWLGTAHAYLQASESTDLT